MTTPVISARKKLAAFSPTTLCRETARPSFPFELALAIHNPASQAAAAKFA